MIDTIKATYMLIDRKRRRHSFELFGYDFMVDEKFKVYLIEVNINPCLDVTSSFSSRFVTSLLESTLRVAVDPLFPPPIGFLTKKNPGEVLGEIKYELIFDQRTDGKEIENLYATVDLSMYANKLLGKLNKELEYNKGISEEDYPD